MRNMGYSKRNPMVLMYGAIAEAIAAGLGQYPFHRTAGGTKRARQMMGQSGSPYCLNLAKRDNSSRRRKGTFKHQQFGAF